MYNLVYKTPTCTLHGHVHAPDTVKHEDLIKLAAEAWGVTEYNISDWTVTLLTGPQGLCANVY